MLHYHRHYSFFLKDNCDYSVVIDDLNGSYWSMHVLYVAVIKHKWSMYSVQSTSVLTCSVGSYLVWEEK